MRRTLPTSNALDRLLARAQRANVESADLLIRNERLVAQRGVLLDEHTELMSDIAREGRSFCDAIALSSVSDDAPEPPRSRPESSPPATTKTA